MKRIAMFLAVGNDGDVFGGTRRGPGAGVVPGKF